MSLVPLGSPRPLSRSLCYPISPIRGDTLVQPLAGCPSDTRNGRAARGVNGIVTETQDPEWLRSMNQRYFGIGNFRYELFALNRKRVLTDEDENLS